MMRNEGAAGVASIGGAGETATGKSQSQYYSTTAARQSQPQHGRVCGGVWSKSVRASVHRLRSPKGWALDIDDLNAAEQCGAVFVHLHDLEQLTHYWARLSDVRRYGFAFERGFGAQIALVLERWAASRDECERIAEPSAGAPLQMSLWETRP